MPPAVGVHFQQSEQCIGLPLSLPGALQRRQHPPASSAPHLPCSSVTFELLPRGALPSPMQQCWHVNAWALLAVGALLPLLVLRGWERAARRRRDCEPCQEAAESKAAGDSAACCSTQIAADDQQIGSNAGGQDSNPATAEPGTFVLRPPGWWLLEPWLASALLWRVAGLAAALLV